MSHDDDSLLRAIENMADADLNAEIATSLGIKTLPSVRHVLDRLQRECGIKTKIEPTENPEEPKTAIHRVFIKPLAYRAISVTAPSPLRAVRVALLVWLRYDPSAPPLVRKALRV